MAMVTLILVDCWQWTPFVFIIVFARLQALPREVFEAADVDGAGPIVKFRRVILPMLMPAIVFAAVFRAVDAFRSFDLIYGLSYGGPARGTTTLAFFSFQNGFQFQNYGYAAAVAYTMLIIVAVGTTVLLRYVQLRPGSPMSPRRFIAYLVADCARRDRRRPVPLSRRAVHQEAHRDRGAGAAQPRFQMGDDRQELFRGAFQPGHAFLHAELDHRRRPLDADRAGDRHTCRLRLLAAASLPAASGCQHDPVDALHAADRGRDPAFLMVRAIGLQDSYPGLILPYVAIRI